MCWLRSSGFGALFVTFVLVNKLDYIIRELLLRQEKAFLPGLGMLTLFRSGAKIDTQQGVVRPPKDQLDFIASQNIHKDHLKQQLEALPLPGTVNVPILLEEILSILANGMDSDQFTLGDWVTFTKEQSGQFTANILNEDELSPINGLPVLSLPDTIPVDSVEEVASATAITHEKTDGTDAQKRKWQIPALITFLILILSFTIWWYTPEISDAGDPFSKLLVKERVNVSPSKAEKKQKEQWSADTVVNKDKDVMAKDSTIEEEDLDTPASDTSTTGSEMSKPEGTTIEKSITSSEYGEDCVVVVGSFSKNSNVERMKQRLVDNGHRVFTQDINGLTRVGLYVDCAPDPLDSMLREARTNIEDAAWILEE